jgi:hypothetical protein
VGLLAAGDGLLANRSPARYLLVAGDCLLGTYAGEQHEFSGFRFATGATYSNSYIQLIKLLAGDVHAVCSIRNLYPNVFQIGSRPFFVWPCHDSIFHSLS